MGGHGHAPNIAVDASGSAMARAEGRREGKKNIQNGPLQTALSGYATQVPNRRCLAAQGSNLGLFHRPGHHEDCAQRELKC